MGPVYRVDPERATVIRVRKNLTYKIQDGALYRWTSIIPYGVSDKSWPGWLYVMELTTPYPRPMQGG